MADDPKLSLGTVMVLHALARGRHYGFDIMDDTGLTSGTIYPALDRLEELGFTSSEWEDAKVAQAERRPPRKYFRITRRGERVLATAMERYRSLAPVEIRGVKHPRPSRRTTS